MKIMDRVHEFKSQIKIFGPSLHLDPVRSLIKQPLTQLTDLRKIQSNCVNIINIGQRYMSSNNKTKPITDIVVTLVDITEIGEPKDNEAKNDKYGDI